MAAMSPGAASSYRDPSKIAYFILPRVAFAYICRVYRYETWPRLSISFMGLKSAVSSRILGSFESKPVAQNSAPQTQKAGQWQKMRDQSCQIQPFLKSIRKLFNQLLVPAKPQSFCVFSWRFDATDGYLTEFSERGGRAVTQFITIPRVED